MSSIKTLNEVIKPNAFSYVSLYLQENFNNRIKTC